MVEKKGKITNKDYQQLCNISERTASRELSELIGKSIFEQIGITGKGTRYILKTPQRRQIEGKN